MILIIFVVGFVSVFVAKTFFNGSNEAFGGVQRFTIAPTIVCLEKMWGQTYECEGRLNEQDFRRDW